MVLLFGDLPGGIQDAYEDSGIQGIAASNLSLLGGAAIIEAILIVDNAGGIVYTTRDGGESFEVGEIANTVHLSEHRRYGENITVLPLVNISMKNVEALS